MRKIMQIGYGAAFATATTAFMLLGAASTPTDQPASFTNIAAQVALADEGENSDGNRDHGDQNCSNRAGHERGWCKHDNGERQEHNKRHKHHKHDGDDRSASNTTISGTVVGINGNLAQVRLDDGRTVSVDAGGTALNVGQHYTLGGCFQNSVFVVNCNGNGSNQGGYGQQQVNGTILSVNGNIVTLAGLPPVRIDISQAQANGAISGSLTPARQITAYGHAQNGTFFATSIR